MSGCRGPLSLFVAAAILAAVSPLHPQTGLGTVVGLVSDTSGAIVPGVAVRVTNKLTGVVAASATNHEGLFRVPSLTPGMYEVAFESQGF